MREIRILFGYELRALFSLNRLRCTRDKKEKNRFLLLAAAWAMVILMCVGYVSTLVYGLCTLGAADAAVSYLTVVASALIVAVGLFSAGGTVFARGGYDLLASMPVRTSSIVISRILVLYFEDLLFTLAVFLPGCVTYAILVRPGVLFYLCTLMGALFVPAIPLVLSVTFGTVILALTSRLRHKSIVQTALMLVFVLGVLLGPMLMGDAETVTEEMLVSLVALLADTIGGLYPPALWLGNAALGRSVWGLPLFMLVSSLLFVLCTAVAVRAFPRVLHGLSAAGAKRTYHLEARRVSLSLALFRREWKRYFSSSIYVTNTIIGPIMGTVLAGALYFGGPETVMTTLPASLPLPFLLPLAIGAVFTMMPPTAAAISMEGKQICIVQSLPIPVRAWLDAKLLVTLSLMLPFYLVSEVFLFLALRPTLTESYRLLCMPAALMLFAAVFGITVNLKLHRFDWTREEQVVKQGASTLIAGFAGVVLALLFGVLLILTPEGLRDGVCAGLCIATLLLTAWLYRRNQTVRMENLS